MSETAIFFYGHFMDPELLRAQGYNPSEPVVAKLDNFELLIAARATLRPYSESHVWGTVMSLSDPELSRLYSTPTVADYIPQEVDCATAQSNNLKALVYNLPVDYPLCAPKDQSYAAKLYEICKKQSLPSTYCEHIRNLIPTARKE